MHQEDLYATLWCRSTDYALVNYFIFFHFFSLTQVLMAISGFHAKDPESFAQVVHEVIAMEEGERRSIRARARQWATTRFSQEAFEKGWTQSGWSRWL